MISRFLSQKCMEFSNSRFVAQKCMTFSNSRFFVRRVRRRRRPPSVLRPVRPSPSSVVVVLCPSVRPSSVVVPYLQIQGRMQIFKKKHQNRGREYEIRIELEIQRWIAGGKLLCVLKKLVLRPKHFCFRILVPMSILTFWILYIMMII